MSSKKERPVCSSCRTPISGRYFQDAQKRILCVTCSDAQCPECPACGKKVTGAGLRVPRNANNSEKSGGAAGGEDTYHPECFRCADCSKAINGSFHQRPKTGAFVCSECADAERQSAAGTKHSTGGARGKADNAREPGSSSSSSDVCFGCKRPFGPGEQMASVEGKTYHPKCFACYKCRKPINGSFLKDDKGYSCMNCIPKCPVCKQSLQGSVISVAEQSLHADCFRCCACRGVLSDGYFPDPIGNGSTKDLSGFVCKKCYTGRLEKREEMKFEKEAQLADEATRKQERDNGLQWHPQFAGSSAECLQALGIELPKSMRRSIAGYPTAQDRASLPSSKDWAAVSKVCLMLDPVRGLSVGREGDADAAREYGVNLHYMVEALKLLGSDHGGSSDYQASQTFGAIASGMGLGSSGSSHQSIGREPVFSLDPYDPKNLNGDFQKKRFEPEHMANTPLGEVLFQADYFLKKFSFGDVRVPGCVMPSLFDTDLTNTAARQWFVIRDAKVVVSADHVIYPELRIEVEARRLVLGEKGYEDAAHTSDDDPAVQHARDMSKNMKKIARAIPSVAELVEVCRAITLAVFLVKVKQQKINFGQLRKFRPRSVMQHYPKTAGSSYPKKIPTLRKVRKTVHVGGGAAAGGGAGAAKSSGGAVSIETRQHAMFGGVDLAVPVEKIEEHRSKKSVLAPHLRPAGANKSGLVAAAAGGDSSSAGGSGRAGGAEAATVPETYVPLNIFTSGG